MEEECNFKKPLSFRELSAAKFLKNYKSVNNSDRRMYHSTVRRFFSRNPAFKVLPKSIYKDLILSNKRHQFKNIILFRGTKSKISV